MLDIEKEKAAFLDIYKYYPSAIKFTFDAENECFVLSKKNQLDHEVETMSQMNQQWLAWLRRAKIECEKLDGCVVVPKDQISCFWQDSNEPENFCNSLDNLDNLGDCIDLGDIMEINKHIQANIKTEKLYGTWAADYGNPIDRSRSRFFVGTRGECEAIILENEQVFEAARGGNE